eukprot:scaffold6767_cov223-Isochrysis_galbana.AAC.2
MLCHLQQLAPLGDPSSGVHPHQLEHSRQLPVQQRPQVRPLILLALAPLGLLPLPQLERRLWPFGLLAHWDARAVVGRRLRLDTRPLERARGLGSRAGRRLAASQLQHLVDIMLVLGQRHVVPLIFVVGLLLAGSERGAPLRLEPLIRLGEGR